MVIRGAPAIGVAAAMGTAGLGHTGEKGLHCAAVGVEEGSALHGNLVQLFRAITGADRHIAELLKEGERWIDDARTGAIGTGDPFLDRLDDFVPVPGLLGDEVQDNQAKVSVGEEAAEALLEQRLKPQWKDKGLKV